MILPISPAITLFPPLALREDDDGNVESLDHYLVRLADCLGISVLSVFRMLASRSSAGGLPSRDVANRNAWIGPSPRTAECVSSLIQATGVPDLYRGTFRNLSLVLSGIGFANCNASANARKWCPRCYLDWEDSSSFEPLYWSFGALSTCPLHRCRMRSRCRHCGCRQHHGSGYRTRRRCRSCLAPLGEPANAIGVADYEAWVDMQCVMTAHAASITERVIAPNNFDLYFERVLARWQEGEPVAAYVKASMSNLQRRWKKGERHLRPTFVQYLNFASFHGTNVDEILLSPDSAAAEPLIEGARNSFTRYTLRRPLIQTLDALREAFDNLLASDIPYLPTAATVCAFFEVDYSYVRERMKDAADSYSNTLVRQGRRHSKQELRRAFACAISLHESNSGASPSRDVEDTLRIISTRARCGIEVATCAHRAAGIALSARSQASPAGRRQ